jgi:TPR repeat protein
MRRDELERDAERGLVPAQSLLGIAYLYGYHFDDGLVEPDYAKAKELLEAAAARGAPRAVSNLGYMYEHGLGCSRDVQRAIELYEKAVQGGEYFPCLWLARIYARGTGGEAEAEKARGWYGRVLAFNGRIDDEEGIAEAESFLSVGHDA